MNCMWKYYITKTNLHYSISMFVLLFLFGEVTAESINDAFQQVDVVRNRGKISKNTESNGLATRVDIKPFARADADHDNKLSFGEFENLRRLQHMEANKRRKLFSYLDLNRDGFLQMQEVHPSAAKWLKLARKNFSRLDQNKNGELDMNEFLSLSLKSKVGKVELVREFQRLDKNNNRVVEKIELAMQFLGCKQRAVDFISHDKDSSGSIDYDEYSSMPMISKWPEIRRQESFQRIDVDGNGQLSKRELSSIKSRKRFPSGFSPSRVRPKANN